MTTRRIRFGVVVTILSLSAALAVAAEPPPSNEELARELMVLTGAGDVGKQVMGQMIDAFRRASPEVPEQFWDEFLANVDPDELIEMSVPIYVKHLTREELEAAIGFYSSPEGRSLITKLPAVMQESMEAGQAWGEQLGRNIAEKMDLYRRAEAAKDK